jgi:hypothetical protein
MELGLEIEFDSGTMVRFPLVRKSAPLRGGDRRFAGICRTKEG